jgi:membrane protein YqaA with SNARE-associated domain
MFESAIQSLMGALAIPGVGLPALFIISLLASTLLPLGSEPALLAVVIANQSMFWQAIFVATLGNTLGSVIGYWMGYEAKQVFAKERKTHWFGWLLRFGPKTLLLSWAPVIGDPLCVVAGWLKMPFWPCVFYMAIGKFLRYVIITAALLHLPNGFWAELLDWLE